MTRRQKHVLLSVAAIQDCLVKHESCYRGVPGFIDQIAVFRRLAAKAEVLRGRTNEADTPAVQEPAETEALIQSLLVASGPLEGWAAILGDELLRSQAGTKRNELRAMGAGLSGHARTIWEIGTESMSRGAGHYGLRKEMLDRLHACIERCEATTDEGSATLRQAADRLYFFLRDVMDPLVRGFLLSAPEFCADYKKARKAAAVQDRTTANPAGNLAQDAVLNA